MVELDPLRDFEDLVQRNGHDVGGLESDHVVPFLFSHCADSRAAESHREQPVVACRLSSALKMAEDE